MRGFRTRHSELAIRTGSRNALGDDLKSLKQSVSELIDDVNVYGINIILLSAMWHPFFTKDLSFTAAPT